MKQVVFFLLFVFLTGGVLWAQCQNNPYSSPVIRQKTPVHSKYYIRRINQAPIRRIQNYPSYSYPTYRQSYYTRRNCSTPNTYVYSVPTPRYNNPVYTTPSYQEAPETNTYVYNNYYEYVDDSDSYSEYLPQKPIYTPPPISENRTNSYSVEQPLEAEEDSFVRSSPKKSEPNIPIPDFFYYLETGKEFFKRRQYEQAAKEFSQAALLDRYSYAAHWGHGMSLFALGRYSSASFSIRKGFDLITNPFGIRENLRAYYQDLSLFDEQILQLQKYLTTYPFDLDAHFFLAFAHFYTKNYAASQSILDYMLKIDPQDSHANKLRQSISEEFERRKQYQIPMPTMPQTESVPSKEEAPKKEEVPHFEEDREFEDHLLELSKPETLTPHSEDPVLTPEELAPVEEEATIPTEEHIHSENSTPDELAEEETQKETSSELTPEEKQKIIDENTAKTLENYEKILEEAGRSSTKKKMLSSSDPENSKNIQEIPPSEPKKVMRTREILLQEIQQNQQQFQDRKLHILNAYANLKQQYYAKEIEETEYQLETQRYNREYKQAILECEQRKEKLQSELDTLR